MTEERNWKFKASSWFFVNDKTWLSCTIVLHWEKTGKPDIILRQNVSQHVKIRYDIIVGLNSFPFFSDLYYPIHLTHISHFFLSLERPEKKWCTPVGKKATLLIYMQERGRSFDTLRVSSNSSSLFVKLMRLFTHFSPCLNANTSAGWWETKLFFAIKEAGSWTWVILTAFMSHLNRRQESESLKFDDEKLVYQHFLTPKYWKKWNE